MSLSVTWRERSARLPAFGERHNRPLGALNGASVTRCASPSVGGQVARTAHCGPGHEVEMVPPTGDGESNDPSDLSSVPGNISGTGAPFHADHAKLLNGGDRCADSGFPSGDSFCDRRLDGGAILCLRSGALEACADLRFV